MTWYSEHVYRETNFCQRVGVKELEETSKLHQKEYKIETTQLFPTIKQGDFVLQSFVEIMKSS